MRPKPYVRPMAGWWRRDPFFMRYMVREATALGVAAYALVLLAGVWRLAQGQAAFEGWLQWLRSPWSIAFHLLLLLGMAYHTLSWFQIMPKTMPLLFVRGERVPASTITRAGLAAALLVTLVVLALAWGTR
ncbi:fumarate reductase subunit C [Aquincola sp. S2]|uniref:Fumarate reductase subunit C n=1 Tax=Pseudaquabacterium terrae TaxID=2732868 RepID=A0ABX2ER86_9BURK|nr:fumarate reductase subunit C [Aquabacterium terrae]NRF71069.1 fumarate reductase subunit C [Aquabacterium terrae]